MARGNHTIYLPTEREDPDFGSKTEKCLNTSTSSQKMRFAFLSAFLITFVFIIGLVIGLFTRTGISSDSDINHRASGDYNKKLETLLKLLDNEELGRFSRYFSHEPHQAGSRRSEELADEIKRRWNNYGFHVETWEYNVLLPRAKEDNPDYFEIKDQNGNITMRHTFAAVGKSDPESNKTWSVPSFFFYGPSGSVEGGLLYVHDGRKEDFEHLKKINITSCNGSVVIMTYSFSSIGQQLKNAYNCNASGVLFFSKQLKIMQTSGNSSVYPLGPRLPKEQPLIIGLEDHWQVGDILTPNLPASDGIYRVEKIDWAAKLPVQLVDYDLAIILLQQLKGSALPEQWKPDNDTDYRVGPSLKNNATFNLTVNSKSEMTKIHDVIGTVYGHEEPDSWVLVGNHRDAISFGAGDAGSGTSGMMELSRGIGELLKKGWKPRRTIKVCSWAAEEVGLIGSTEYVQDNKKLLQERAVAYINMDNLVHGNDSIKATGNPMTMDLVYTQSMMVADPHGPQESIYSVWKRSRPDLNGKDRPQFHTVGFGSDYIPFYDMAGVPSIDLQYAKVPYALPQSYHTVYDTYHLISMFDPHFMFHLAQTKLTARIVYALSNSELIPFNLNSFTSSLREITNRTKVAYEKDLNQHGINLKPIIKAVNDLAEAGWKFEKIKNQTDPQKDPAKIRMLNRRMVAFNKLFISPQPIPNRFDLRNLVLGISQNLRYPDITLAGITDALLAANTSGRWEMVKLQVSLTHHAITQASRSLEIP